ncbi:hypothetical protein [Streptomyces sp. NPDC048611]|uniref:hypothetical protein n=1 Tax=Streptomyces sp. NPDC048611 TaxID=3155635 RepID=UPI00343BA7C5
MAVNPEQYRLTAEAYRGVATVAVLCVQCHEADGEATPVKVFDFLFPSIADVQATVDRHHAEHHGSS